MWRSPSALFNMIANRPCRLLVIDNILYHLLCHTIILKKIVLSIRKQEGLRQAQNYVLMNIEFMVKLIIDMKSF